MNSVKTPGDNPVSLKEWDRIIIGVDPGTNVMGYGILGVKSKKPAMIALGVIELNKFESHYLRLRRIYDRILSLVDQYLPDEMAIEAPFFGKNVQSMLKLGRAQGVAMAAALSRDVPITEYEPRKIKMAITGNGAASKEQVREMLRRILAIPEANLLPQLDSTDALGAALCHFYESQRPAATAGPRTWKEFLAKHPDRVK
ncbi:crossover junction endodeoxyribonuclease RuvC [Paramuribaculum intestinale]|uniref:crossover junction endodeoxyribonuclease RuvC n=1 Tax=Paramuribaculum intestinale TaxID=2094151 RepID=UPI0026F3B1B7|nr:crossover junction endodeoxyribonuclease RuvC [Paramuribaculum intestinale]